MNCMAISPPLKLLEISRALTGPDLPMSAQTTGIPALRAFSTAGPMAPGSTGVITMPETFCPTRVLMSWTIFTGSEFWSSMMYL